MRLAEGPFGFDVFRIQIAFDDDLGVCRHHDVDGFALHHGDRLAGQAARHAHFIDAVRNLLHRNIGDDRRRADD